MSKQVKQMQMTALKQTFQDVRDLVFLSISGLSCQEDNQMRLGLRKKNIRLQVVKNSLARRVFGELGLQAKSPWEGTTTLAWGANSIAELSRELDALAKKNPKIKVKSAVAEGQEIAFQTALTMPTRTEAIGTIIGMAVGVASQIAGQIAGPAAQIAGQIQTIAEKKPEEPATATPA
jgi:large subunit ribosomal protein L10